MEQIVKETLDKIIDKMISKVENGEGNFSFNEDDYTFSYVTFNPKERDEFGIWLPFGLAAKALDLLNLFKENANCDVKTAFVNRFNDAFDVSLENCDRYLYNNAETHCVNIVYDFIKVTPDIGKLEEVLKEYNII